MPSPVIAPAYRPQQSLPTPQTTAAYSRPNSYAVEATNASSASVQSNTPTQSSTQICQPVPLYPGNDIAGRLATQAHIQYKANEAPRPAWLASTATPQLNTAMTALSSPLTATALPSGQAALSNSQAAGPSRLTPSSTTVASPSRPRSLAPKFKMFEELVNSDKYPLPKDTTSTVNKSIWKHAPVGYYGMRYHELRRTLNGIIPRVPSAEEYAFWHTISKSLLPVLRIC
jgi:hypothetical protein